MTIATTFNFPFRDLRGDFFAGTHGDSILRNQRLFLGFFAVDPVIVFLAAGVKAADIESFSTLYQAGQRLAQLFDMIRGVVGIIVQFLVIDLLKPVNKTHDITWHLVRFIEINCRVITTYLSINGLNDWCIDFTCCQVVPRFPFRYLRLTFCKPTLIL